MAPPGIAISAAGNLKFMTPALRKPVCSGMKTKLALTTRSLEFSQPAIGGGGIGLPLATILVAPCLSLMATSNTGNGKDHSYSDSPATTPHRRRTLTLLERRQP